MKVKNLIEKLSSKNQEAEIWFDVPTEGVVYVVRRVNENLSTDKVVIIDDRDIDS